MRPQSSHLTILRQLMIGLNKGWKNLSTFNKRKKAIPNSGWLNISSFKKARLSVENVGGDVHKVSKTVPHTVSTGIASNGIGETPGATESSSESAGVGNTRDGSSTLGGNSGRSSDTESNIVEFDEDASIAMDGGRAEGGVDPHPCRECRNCHRVENTALHGSFPIHVQSVRLDTMMWDRAWSTFLLTDVNAEESCMLCEQCRRYLRKGDDKVDPNDWRYMWPAYVWKLLTDESVVAEVGADAVWKVIPFAWREWWIESVKERCPLYDVAAISLMLPPPLFVDITKGRDEFLNMRKNLRWAEIIDVVDRRLETSVLCPWGCCEFPHECGSLALDAVLQTFIPEARIPMTPKGKNTVPKCTSARKDYLSATTPTLLLCPEMKVSPSVAFVEGKGMCVLTCSEHDGGTTDMYFHVPRSDGRLPAMEGDQLAPAVISNRVFKPMVPKEYNTTHQMSKQVGGFGGIDTCMIRSHGRFDFHAHVLSKHESLSIAGRQDIDGLVDRLVSEGRLASEAARNMKELSQKRHGESIQATRSHSLEGATYMSFRDAITLQSEVSKPCEVRVVSTNDIGVEIETFFKPNWVRSILFVHGCDEYGAMIHTPPILNPRSGDLATTDFRLVWCMSVICTNVPTIWKALSDNVTQPKQWSGFFLSWATKNVIKTCKNSSSLNDVFKNARTWKPDKVLQNMSTTRSTALKKRAVLDGPMKSWQIKDMFRDVSGGKISCATIQDGRLSDRTVRDLAQAFLNSEADVFIVHDRHHRDNGSCTAQIPETVTDGVDGTVYELRIVLQHCEAELSHQDCVAYIRHGEQFSGWWRCTQKEDARIAVKTTASGVPDCNRWFGLVYVKVSSVESKAVRNEFLHHIGGQSHVTCAKHDDIPLIISAVSDDKCRCGKKRYLRCPKPGCTSNICRKCYKDVSVEDGLSVQPVEVPGNTNGGSNGSRARRSANSTRRDDDEDSDNDEDIEQEHGRIDVSLVDDEEESQARETSRPGSPRGEGFDDEFSIGSDEDDEQSRLMEPNMFLSTGFEEPLFDTELFPSDDPDHCQLENAEVAMEGCIPTTGASLTNPPIFEHDEKSNIMGNHILLKGVGSLCVRDYHRSSLLRHQQQLLQQLASAQGDSPVPLLYPEGMLFPSIFSFDNSHDGSLVGAIPCGLLSQEKHRREHGIASLADHTKARLKGAGLTSMDPGYTNWMYDCLVNASLTKKDSRLVLNRGLVESGGRSGLRLRNEDDTFFTDSIDNKGLVHKLTAAQQYRPMNLFLTFTANQKLTFGMRKTKAWIDSDEWMKHYPGSEDLSAEQIVEIQRCLHNASATIMNRHWLQVRHILLEYLMKSEEKPCGDMDTIFARDEYQGHAGNLCHVHLIARVKVDTNDPDAVETFRNCIRGFIGDIIRIEEVDDYIAEGLLKEKDDWYVIQSLAETILTHRSARNMKRVGTADGDVVARDYNKYFSNPDPTNYTTVHVDPKHTENAIKILSDCGLAGQPPEDDPGKLVDCHPLLECKREFPPMRRHDGNMSPVIPRLFIGMPSMMNAQPMTGYSVNRYVVKYVADMDKNTQTIFNVDINNPTRIKADTEFLFNTKVTSSAIGTKMRLEKKRNKKHVQGRCMSRHEMVQVLLGDPQVRTNLAFKRVSTAPLSERPGMEKRARVNTRPSDDELELSRYRRQCGNDSVAFVMLPDQVRREVSHLAQWRQFTPSQVTHMNDTFFSKVSLDAVTVYGLRPPELRVSIRNIGQYYRWFVRKNDSFAEKQEELQKRFSKQIEQCEWIDGLGHQILLRANAITTGELKSFVQDISRPRTRENRRTFGLFKLILDLHDKFGFTTQNDSQVQHADLTSFERWENIQRKFIDLSRESTEDMLPIPVYSNMKPTNTSRFLFHLLLSMGQYDTEMDLIVHPNARRAFVEAKLIDENDLEGSVNLLLKKWIVEQLCYYPIGTKKFDFFLETAATTLKEAIINDRTPIFEMPACLYTKLQEEVSEKVSRLVNHIRDTSLSAAYRELEIVSTYQESFPSLNDFKNGNASNWNGHIEKFPRQSDESFEEQDSARRAIIESVNHYGDPSRKTGTKNMIIAGAPGAGKTHVMEFAVLFNLSRGHLILPIAVLADRALAIGGIHFHRLFKYRKSYGSAQMLAEQCLIRLLKDEGFIHLIRIIDGIALDEMLTTTEVQFDGMDIIIRRIRGVQAYMGGLQVYGTLDSMQTQPIDGHPSLLSPHILSCFCVRKLRHSVRAADDPRFRRIQDITRLSFRHLAEHPEVKNEFRQLCSETLTFVRNWDDPRITENTICVFSKQEPTKERKALFVTRLIDEKDASEIRIRTAEDLQLAVESHGDWEGATARTSRFLSKNVKEPEKLVFVKNGLYMFTFNEKNNKFSQSRLGFLTELPSQEDINNFKPVCIWAAPPGCKTTPADSTSSNELREMGWEYVTVGACPEIEHPFTSAGLRTMRKQYGLQHYISSTIHGTQGSTLLKLASQISNKDERYKLWEKGQLVVLLSRTKHGEDTIFVGDKKETLDMLCDALYFRSQFAEYMEHVLDTLAGEESEAPVIQASIHPYRPCDMPLPRDVGGFCYLLVSSQNWSSTYIGETSELHRRIMAHNSGHGSKQTSPFHLRPWVLVVYVTGFCGNVTERKNFEKAWQNAAKAKMQDPNSRSVEAIIATASELINRYAETMQLDRNTLPLRVVQFANLSTNET